MSSGTEASSGGGNFQRPQYSGDIPALELESSEDILFSNELTPKQIAKKVRPSVVGVLAYLMEDGEMVKVGEGSGIILSEDGFIITNAHVIINSEMSYNAVSYTHLDVYKRQDEKRSYGCGGCRPAEQKGNAKY